MNNRMNNRMNKRMNKRLYEEYFKDNIELNPSINIHLKLKKYSYLDGKLENKHSDYHIQREFELAKKYIKRVTTIPKVQRSIYDKMILSSCKLVLEGEKFRLERIPFTAQDNELAFLADIASGNGILKFNSKKDYILFIETIQIFPDIVSSVIVQFNRGKKDRFTLPKRLAIELRDQIASLIKNKAWINRDIKIKLNVNFNSICGSIFEPEFKRLQKYLDEDYIPYCRNSIGVLGLRDGKAIYEYLVKLTLMDSGVNIPQIHQFGVLEVERIREEMIKIKDELGQSGNLKTFFKWIKNRNDLKFKNNNELILTYKKQIETIKKTIMPDLFYTQVKNKCLVKVVPKFNEDYTSEAYYLEGNVHSNNPGRFFINTKYLDKLSKIDVESLTLHETYPGHHYQLSYVNENASIPLFIKIQNVESYIEGWGLYCENLGTYSTPESYFGKLVLELVRAIRLVVDTGIHYYGWSYDTTFKYMKTYGFEDDAIIHDYIIRYMSIPSQALAYKMGEKCIIECLNKFLKAGGTDLKDFHKLVLEDGPINLYLLREKF